MTSHLKKGLYVIAYILFPTVNLLLARYTDIFTENYSYVGNELQHTSLFHIWGTMCSLYFFVMTTYILKKINRKTAYDMPVLYFSCIGMILSVHIPYQPEIYPVIGELHIYISIAATVSYVLLFFHILLEMPYKNFRIYKRFYPFYAGLVSLCLLVMILFGGVNTIMEFTFSCGQALLLIHLADTLDKEGSICI